MTRCTFCRKKSGLNIICCKSCKKLLCTRCIDMSIHKCDNLEEYKQEQRNILENSLLSNKTVDSKIKLLKT